MLEQQDGNSLQGNGSCTCGCPLARSCAGRKPVVVVTHAEPPEGTTMRAHGTERGPKTQQSGAPPLHSARPAPPGQTFAASGVPPTAILRLQRIAGNTAVLRMLEQNEPHRVSHEDQGEQAPLQHSTVHEVLRTSGRPLDAPLREEMEARLGADFSDVRLHTDGAARASAAEIGAHAYTSGSHVVIGAAGADKHTLAHELTHVVQQRRGPVSSTDHGDGLRLSDPSDRFEREAEATATRVMAGSPPADTGRPPRTTDIPRTPATTGDVPFVARVMDMKTFREGTSSRRPRISVRKVDAALAAYESVGSTDYRARSNALDVLVEASKKYEAGSMHQQLRIESVALLRREAEAEREVFKCLIEADLATTLVEKVTRLFTAQEVGLKVIDAFDYEHTTAIQNLHFQALLTTSIRALQTQDASQLVTLVESDVRALRAVQSGSDLPQVTHDTLAEILANIPKTDFREGRPGTDKISAAPGASRYTVNHSLSQADGEAERLGSLAHELTHVAGSEAYDNTQIMLLVDSGLSEDQMVRIAERRIRTVADLEQKLEQQSDVNPRQLALINSKLQYAKGQKLLIYASSYEKSGKIDTATGARLKSLAARIGEGNSVLVEYDTVLTQLLVYMHQWKIPQSNPFYSEVREAAQQAGNERRTAKASANWSGWSLP